MAQTAVYDDKVSAARAQYKKNRQYLENQQKALQKSAGHPNSVPDALIFRRLSYSSSDRNSESRLCARFVEPLLQQASGLVDRVLAEDPTYRQLQIDQLNLRLDLQELEALQDINDDEVAAGLFQVPYWDASATLESDKAAKKAQTDLTSWIKQNSDPQRKLAAWSTENAQQPLATGWESKLSQHSLRLYGGYTIDSSLVPAGAKATDGNIIGGVLSSQLADYNFSYQQQQLTAQSAAIDARNVPLSKRVDYLQADSGFKERRKIVAHQKLVDKLAAVQLSNGALNYADRISAIEDRAAYDLHEAYARLRMLREGLALVYAMQAPELPAPPSTGDGPIDPDFMNKLVVWIRHVSMDLQELYNKDQDVIVTIRLKEYLKDHRFHEGRKQGGWEFEIGADRFKGFKLVRLRGLSAVADCNKHRSYSLMAFPPSSSFAIYQASESVPVKQQVDACWMGRIVPADVQSRPEVSGSRVLWNSSPFGRWSLTAGRETSLDDLKDLDLNLHVTTQRL
jgi:hypothetical protein